jgi:superfamily I DNA/RNA helicase
MTFKKANEEQEEILDKKTLLDLSRFLLILDKCVELGDEMPADLLAEGFDLYRLNINDIQELGGMFFDDIVSTVQRLNPFYTKYRSAKKSFTPDSLKLRMSLIEGCFKYLSQNGAEVIKFGENNALMINYIKDINLGVLEKKTKESLKLLINIPSFLYLKTSAKSPTSWIKKLILSNITNSSDVEKLDQLIAIKESYLNIATEIKNIDTQLRGKNPNTKEFIDLQDERKEKLESLIREVQEHEGKDAKSVLNSLTSTIHSTDSHLTETGKRLNLTPEQENAMIVDGKAIIAAGAGSGKTRVLAGRVAWLIKEKGVPANRIMATSFTRNSAVELKERIQKPEFAGTGAIYGDGFGTSHSIAYRILMKNTKDNGKVDHNLDSKLVDIAINQVRMSSNIPKNQVGKFSNKPMFDQYTEQDINNYIQIINNFMGYANHFMNDPNTNPQEKQILSKDIALLNVIQRNKILPYDLDASQKEYLNSMINSERGKKVFGKLLAQDKLENLERLQKFGKSNKTSAKSFSELEAETDKSEKGISAKESPYFAKQVANMWFNLGLNKEDITNQQNLLKHNNLYGEAEKLEEDFKKFNNKVQEKWFHKEVSKFYNNVMSVKQVKDFLKPDFLNNTLVAVYGAYLWLKENDATFRGYCSGDDQLVKTIGLLVKKPGLLEALQNQYDHIMVDEAQDLNQSQHIFFGLIAGTINPGNLMPYTDDAMQIVVKDPNKPEEKSKVYGRMKAKSYVLIGDDKQAIYEFRGAEPKEFIGKSDLLNGGFQTAIIPTNFRSGNNIVDTANKLIAYNEQIPMTCVSVPSKGEGTIYFEKTKDATFGSDAIRLIEEIKTHISLGGNVEDYGVATRSTREAYPFLLQALKNKIPFRSQTNPLSKSNFKGVFKWLDFISLPDTAVNELNNYVLTLHNTGPVFFLGEKNFNSVVKDLMQSNKNINLLKDLSERNFPATEVSLREYVESYLSVLKQARTINGNATDCFNSLLSLIDIKKEKDERGRWKSRTFKDIFFPLSKPLSADDDEVEDTSSDLEIMKSLIDFRHKPDVVTLSDAIKEINKFVEQVSEAKSKNTGMLIDTMHQWKGLECRYLTTTFSANFPREKKREQTEKEYEAEIASERRLAYVALTRGQDSVKVLATDEKRTWDATTGTWKVTPSQLSRFIEEGCIPQKETLEKKSSLDFSNLVHAMIFEK